MDTTELQQVQPHALLRFAKASKRFISPFGYLGAAHWAETDYGLSAGQHAVLQEGKGKGKVRPGNKTEMKYSSAISFASFLCFNTFHC